MNSESKGLGKGLEKGLAEMKKVLKDTKENRIKGWNPKCGKDKGKYERDGFEFTCEFGTKRSLYFF